MDLVYWFVSLIVVVVVFGLFRFFSLFSLFVCYFLWWVPQQMMDLVCWLVERLRGKLCCSTLIRQSNFTTGPKLKKEKGGFSKFNFLLAWSRTLKHFLKTCLTYPLVLLVLRKHSYRLDNWSSHFLRQSVTSPKNPSQSPSQKSLTKKVFQLRQSIWSGPVRS